MVFCMVYLIKKIDLKNYKICMNTIKNIQIIKRFYSTPRGIYNFKVINTQNNTQNNTPKYIKPALMYNSSYMNMYNVLKLRINQYTKAKKD